MVYVCCCCVRVVREVMFPGSHPREVKLLDLARLYSGEYFGEMALLGLDADALWHKQGPRARSGMHVW